RRLGAAYEAAGQRAGRGSVAVGCDAARDGGNVSVGALLEPGSAGREIGDDTRRRESQAIVVDHVEIAAIAAREHAAIVQTDGGGRVVREHFHRRRQTQPLAGALPGPVREYVLRQAGVADTSHVGTAVAETE